jgi:hypothetical protein
MILIRTGFDGLDLAYNLNIPEDLAETLEAQRKVAEAPDPYLGMIQQNGVLLIVHPTGAKAGYAFRCATDMGGPMGETWFFKRPSTLKPGSSSAQAPSRTRGACACPATPCPSPWVG